MKIVIVTIFMALCLLPAYGNHNLEKQAKELRYYPYYKEAYAKACAKERAVVADLKTGKEIWNSVTAEAHSTEKEIRHNDETRSDKREQPRR